MKQEFLELLKNNVELKKLMFDVKKNPPKNPTKQALDVVNKFKVDFQ